MLDCHRSWSERLLICARVSDVVFNNLFPHLLFRSQFTCWNKTALRALLDQSPFATWISVHTSTTSTAAAEDA